MQCVIYSTYFVKPGTRYEFKTHLTNHCLGIRCGKKLLKVVEPQGIKYKSTFTYFNITEYTKRNQSRINKIDRKECIL